MMHEGRTWTPVYQADMPWIRGTNLGSQHPYSSLGSASEHYTDSVSSLVLSGLSFPSC